MRERLERYFEFERLGTRWRTEILAGVTTFLTMAYIIFVNPSVLEAAGMPFTAVLAATCVSAAFGSILMGIVARYPIAMAPGMGLNAYFAYSVVQGMGLSWQMALGAVFLSGVVFFLLTAGGIREMILYSIPGELYSAVAVGIGLFIALLGLTSSGIVRPDPNTTLALGNLRDPMTVLSLFGLLLMAALMVRRVSSAMVIGVLVTTGVGAVFGLLEWNPQTFSLSDITATALALDIRGVLRVDLIDVVLVFLFVTLFDDIGTLVAVGKKAKLFDASDRIPRANHMLTCSAAATTVGSLAGTSTVTCYIESASGVAAGGRSGVTSIVTGLLFVLSLFVAPVIGAIPAAATAPVLILVGALMIGHAAEIDWDKPVAAIPAFVTAVAIPMTFSIANGIGLGFMLHTLLRVINGEGRRVPWLVYLMTILFAGRFFLLGGE